MDIVLGLRGFGLGNFHTKPPTKLLNAWLAGVPFVGGRDSAFLQIANPGEEYLVAESPSMLNNALSKLVDHKQCYEKLRKAGIVRSADFNVCAVTEAWAQRLNYIIDQS